MSSMMSQTICTTRELSQKHIEKIKTQRLIIEFGIKAPIFGGHCACWNETLLYKEFCHHNVMKVLDRFPL